ncbi:F-actin-methionine sulfoxide oxidase MICAL3-like isoform X2 [Varroa jacobsoni]|uniref:F-actin-methionine sulfoxide oxidase MICAL3-like isoform X2 n=1 Tax=Varroa jacobsoni TaxID=62625 RepID=UPI000BF795AF|nr:F-actin-methionine sulfoxide oxidase MICAL3-like isoform X2 [Varroa jacobsoni]
MSVGQRQTSPVGGPGPRGLASPESALAADRFEAFTSAGTFKQVLTCYRQICDILQLTPAPLNQFYPKLKNKLRSWKAQGLWNKLDKRASQKEYSKGRSCENTRVLIIGAGPVGLRSAIEAQLLGAKVVLVEKRDRFSRNNVLHLWPFVIQDLRMLGAKKFFGKFCAGSIDHISIRQLQLILLKVCLLLGVEIHESVTFEDLIEPCEEDGVKTGWRARLTPHDHEASHYEFDFLICADGKRNTIKGFARNEFRGKLAIGITANFINRQTQEENKVPEISGVTFIFNQKFFRDMQAATAIDLENIVYYKDDTHYFVMTAKKQSLIERGVILTDQSDVASLLRPDNVNRSALLDYASDAARFATKDQLPRLEFAVNHYGQPDVAMFDFTSMYASENASRMVERRGKKLLLCLVGDSLLEPFWPTGSGCARGFLSALDTGWMLKGWETQPPVKVIAERESIYRLLNQTSPENLHKDVNQYTINPASRYLSLGTSKVLPGEVQHLCDLETITLDITDSEMELALSSMARKRLRNRSIVNPDSLQLWCEKQVYQYNISIEDMTTSWKDGRALTAILHRYRPELIGHPSELDVSPSSAAGNCQRVFDLLEREYGIPPVMTGQDLAASEIPDKLTMVSYLTQVYETFRGAIPRPPGRSVYKFDDLLEEQENSRPAAPRADLRQAVEKYRHSGGSHGPLREARSRSLYDSPFSSGNPNALPANLATDEGYSHEAAKRSKMTERAWRARTHLEAMTRGHGGVRANDVTPELERVADVMDRKAFNARKERLQEQWKFDSTGARIYGPLESTDGFHQQPPPPPKGIPRKSYALTQRPSIRELQQQLLDLEKGVSAGGSAKKTAPPGHYVGKIGKDDWNVRQLEERLREREKGRADSGKKKSHVEKPQVDWASFHSTATSGAQEALQTADNIDDPEKEEEEKDDDDEETVGANRGSSREAGNRPLNGVVFASTPLRAVAGHGANGSAATSDKNQEKMRMFEEVFRDKRAQMEGRLRGENPERAKYGVIDEKLQRVERQLKDGGVIMDVGERGRNKVAQLKNILDVKAQQNRPAPVTCLNPPKVNKYLSKDYLAYKEKETTSGSSSGGTSGTLSCEDLPGVSAADRDCLDYRSVRAPEMMRLELVALRDAQNLPESPYAASKNSSLSRNERAHVEDTEPVEVSHKVEAGTNIAPVPESSDLCYFCGQRVYLIDRLSAEGHFFHRSCLRCEYCDDNLRIGSYAYDSSGVCRGKFFCVQHFRMEKPSARWTAMMRRKEAFLQEEPRPAQILPTTEETPGDRSVEPSTALQDTQTVQTLAPQRVTPEQALRHQPGISNSLIDIDRDRTPERAEFENLGDASELMDQDNLLNSELDEEELTQRNLGAIEVQTDDDLEQLSSDDEDEDQELMLRAGAVQGLAADADATRHLAETWSKKHNQSCCDSDEEELTDDTTDEETSTEKDEGATTDDVDSDYEYASDSQHPQQQNSLIANNTTAEERSSVPDEISDGTEVDYSTIRRKKPHGAVVTAPVSTKQVSPLVIDITKNSSTGRTPVDNTPTEEGIATAKTKDILQTPGEDHDAGDEGGGDSSEDGLTLSITDSDDDEDEMEADANAGKPHNVTQHKEVPEIVVLEEVALQVTGDDRWGEDSAREALGDATSPPWAVGEPITLTSPPEDAASPGTAGGSVSLTEVSEFSSNEASSDDNREHEPEKMDTDIAKDSTINNDNQNGHKENEIDSDCFGTEPDLTRGTHVTAITACRQQTPQQPHSPATSVLLDSSICRSANPRVPPRASCDQQPVSIAMTTAVVTSPSYRKPISSEYPTPDEMMDDAQQLEETSESSATSTLGRKAEEVDASGASTCVRAATEIMNDESSAACREQTDFASMMTRSDSASDRDQLMMSVRDDADVNVDGDCDEASLLSPTSPLSPSGNNDASGGPSPVSPEYESISKLDDDFPVVRVEGSLSVNNGSIGQSGTLAPVATLETSDEEDLTLSEWAKEGSEHGSALEDLHITSHQIPLGRQLLSQTQPQQQQQPPARLQKGYTFHLSGRRDDALPAQRPNRLEKLENSKNSENIGNITPTNSTDRLNLVHQQQNNETQQQQQQPIRISSNLRPGGKLLGSNQTTVLSGPASVTGQGNPLERSSSANRIDEAAKAASTKNAKISPLPKFTGYGGRFAEKICRPTESDSIYLKTLNIKLKNFEFPSIRSANSSQKGSQDDLLSDDDEAFRTTAGTELQKSATSPSVLDHNKNLHTAVAHATSTGPHGRECDHLINAVNTTHREQQPNRRATSPGRLSQVSQSSVLARDPVAALTQLKAVNEASIYENVNNLPYFDDRISLAGFKVNSGANAAVGAAAGEGTSEVGGDMPPPPPPPLVPAPGNDYSVFATPDSKGREQWRFRTGSVSSLCSIDRERARQEARERAKLKSDAELGISPPSACVRRHRDRLVSEDGAWDPTVMTTQGAVGATPIARHAATGVHPPLRPQSEYLERAPDPEMLSAFQPLQQAKARIKVVQPSPSATVSTTKSTSLPAAAGDSTRKVSSSAPATKAQKTPEASAKKRLFSSGESSPPSKTGASDVRQSRPNSAGHKARNALFSFLTFGSKSSASSANSTGHRDSNGGNINGQNHQQASGRKDKQDKGELLAKSPSGKVTISAKLKMLSPKAQGKTPRGSLASVDSQGGDREEDHHAKTSSKFSKDVQDKKRNLSQDSLRSTGHAGPCTPNSATASSGVRSAGSFSVVTELGLVGSVGSGLGLCESRLGSVGMSTLISGTDLLLSGSESDNDNEPFPDVQDILSDRRVEATDKDKAERFQQRVYKQQELKRARCAQEIQRKLAEIEVERAGIEARGVDVEKELRRLGQAPAAHLTNITADKERLTQELFELLRQKNKLNRREQELLIRAKDLELENRHAKLQKEMRERMAIDDSKKTPQDVGEERAILREMLEILEKRDKLVVLHDQLELKERREEREIENRIKAAHAAHAGAAAAANVDVSAQQFIHIPGLTSDTSHV